MNVETRNVERLLAVGAVAMLHSEPHRKDGPRFKTIIRGWRKGAHVLLDRPKHESGAFAALNEGQPCVIRYLHEGQACAFDTQVMDWDTRKHAPYMRVTWPTKVEFMSFRRYERVHLQVPVEVSASGGMPLAGELVDLSIGGAGVVVSATVAEGSRVQLNFTLPEGGKLENVAGLVKNVRPAKDGHFLGCEFIENQMAVESDIAFFVSRMIELQRQASGLQAGRRVLIIAGDPAMSAKLRKQLERQHFDTVMAANLIDAFHRLRAAQPVAVVVDEALPDLAGTEVCRIIRQSSGIEGIQVFVYGGESDTFEAKAQEMGAAAAIAKSPGMAPDIAFAVSRQFTNATV